MSRMSRRSPRRGATLVEFTLCAIPLLFAWISVVEMARGMWNYFTLQYAVKAAGSYTAVHGATCAQSGNTCTIQIRNIVSVLRTAAIGLPDSNLRATFTSQSGTTKTCNPLNTCNTDTTQWPPTGSSDNAVGKDFTIRVDYTFRSALAMFVPGRGAVRFGTFNFPGYTRQFILF